MAYILRRLLLIVPVLLGVTFITFSISWVANDGHMERGYLTDKMTPLQREQIIDQYDFDRPFFTQYLNYLSRLVKLDLGLSHAQNDRAIIDVYKEFFPATIELTLAAMVCAVFIGIFAGTLSAIRKDAPVDHATRFLALAGVSVPIFWLGLLLKFAFATPFPVELFRAAGPIAKTIVLFFAGIAPIFAGMFLAENLIAERTSWRRLGMRVAIFVAIAAFLIWIGWSFFGILLLIVGGVSYATVGMLKLMRLKKIRASDGSEGSHSPQLRLRIHARAWKIVPAVVLVGAIGVAVSPVANDAIQGLFDFIPDVPLGGRFSNDLVATEGEHPSLTEGPTRILLIDTLLARDWVAFNDVIAHLVLPGITLGYFSLAIIARMMRASMLETLSLDFVRTARAKGLSEQEVIDRHARRNALIPIATVIGLTFGSLLSGAVLTETIFQWPGIGRWSTNAMVIFDTNSVMAFVLLVVVIYVFANLIVDIVYTMLDPRVRLG